MRPLQAAHGQKKDSRMQQLSTPSESVLFLRTPQHVCVQHWMDGRMGVFVGVCIQHSVDEQVRVDRTVVAQLCVRP